MDVSIGNIKKVEFANVWNDSTVLKKLRNRDVYNVLCRSCEFWPVCRGCRALALAVSRMGGGEDYLSGDPQCPYYQRLTAVVLESHPKKTELPVPKKTEKAKPGDIKKKPVVTPTKKPEVVAIKKVVSISKEKKPEPTAKVVVREVIKETVKEPVKHTVNIKRIFEPKEKTDGKRILVDRLWPTGFTKDKANVDEWVKELAASSDLRKWYNNESGKWSDFKKKYRKELSESEKQDALQKLVTLTKKYNVTLVYTSKDTEHNDAVFLKQVIEEIIKKSSG